MSKTKLFLIEKERSPLFTCWTAIAKQTIRFHILNTELVMNNLQTEMKCLQFSMQRASNPSKDRRYYRLINSSSINYLLK